VRSRFTLFLAVTAAAQAAVTAVHLKERTDALGGVSLGEAGAYERITASVRFAVDPKLPANRIVRDIAFASINAQGLVEFSADLYVLRPRDYHRTNGTVLLEVPNRGNKTIFNSFFLARGTQDPQTTADFGDRWLFEQGYVIAWIGWQQDVAPGLLRLEGPSAAGVSGLARHEFIGRAAGPLPFPTSNPSSDHNVLTVRQTAAGARSTVPRNQWHFAEAGSSIALTGGFRPYSIYELIYVAKDPPITGLGLAAVRDMAAYFKYPQPLNQLLADQSLTTKRVVGYGLSQSGRFLRQFLYDGFNADEQGRQVFDGLIVDAAGAGRGSFNHRFAAAGRQGSSVNEHFWPVDIFPFTDVPQTDSETGRTDGLLVRSEQQHVTPKLMLVNSSVEYWARAASLLATSVDAGTDIAPAASTRIYFVAGTTHGGAEYPPVARGTRYIDNFATKYLAVRALLAAMQSWLADGRLPPPSVYPKRTELAPPGRLQPPRVPGFPWPAAAPAIHRLDFGPRFESEGIVDRNPPALGRTYPILVPRVDLDGNDIGGIRLPRVAVPLGTYTGWNYVEPAPAELNPLAGLTGSFLPFAPTKAARERAHDPRLSIEERYSTRDDFLKQVRAEARRLSSTGYMLERDETYCLRQAENEWEYVTRPR
jgi:hypothetical protein